MPYESLFFYTGLLVGATKGSRNLAQEMLGNLHTIQHALRHSMNPTINRNISQFLMSHIKDYQRFSFQNDMKVRHLCSKEDDAARRLFPDANLQFYNTLYTGDSSFTTRSYSNVETTDDSNILFRLKGTDNFGRIRSIVVVNDASPILYVAHFQNVTPLVCPVDSSSKCVFNGIQTTGKLASTFIVIDVDDIIEKTVLFQNSTQSICVARFPNLVHCL